MKIFQEKYPIGTFKGQRTAGIYCDDLLYENLAVLAKAIVKDNTFLLLISSQALSVRTGKSTFAQHLVEAWNHIMLTQHNIKLEISMNNLAFSAEEFELKSFALHNSGNKYSACVLDESDDLTGHALSAEVQKIKRFLRKSGQLNLLMIMILPDFFEFPKTIAVSRSVGLITVDYADGFERGKWKFYDFKAKKKLYILGKKYEDYSVVPPTLHGEFGNGYLVDEKEYRRLKYRDLIDDAEKLRARRIDLMKKTIMVNIFRRLIVGLKGRITTKEICTYFEIDDSTGQRWLKRDVGQAGRNNYNIKGSIDENEIAEVKQIATTND